jgi:hypothetical protein
MIYYLRCSNNFFNNRNHFRFLRLQLLILYLQLIDLKLKRLNRVAQHILFFTLDLLALLDSPSHAFVAVLGATLSKYMASFLIEHGLSTVHVFAVTNTLDAVVLSVIGDFPLVAFVDTGVFIRIPHKNQALVSIKNWLSYVEISIVSLTSN